MYPRRSNTRVKGGPLWTHSHTPPTPMNQSLTHTHAHTELFTGANVYYVQTHRSGFPLKSPGRLPTRGEGWAKARGRNKEPVSGRKPAEPWVVRCLGACLFSYSKMQHCRVGVGRFGINKRKTNKRTRGEWSGWIRAHRVWAQRQRCLSVHTETRRGGKSAKSRQRVCSLSCLIWVRSLLRPSAVRAAVLL